MAHKTTPAGTGNRNTSRQPAVTTLYLATDNGMAVVCEHDNGWIGQRELEGVNVKCVAVDPRDPVLVYCGAFGKGLFHSGDMGATWRRGNGIVHDKVTALCVSGVEDSDGRGVVYTGTEPSAVFRSEDGGGSWRELGGLQHLPSAIEWSFPPRPYTHHVRFILADPHHPGRVFVAIEAGALLRTDNGGRTWKDRVPDGPFDTHELATHRDVPDRLYCAGGDGYFESTDGGESWHANDSGLHHGYCWSVAVDTGDPETVVMASASGPQRAHGQRGGSESFLYRREKEGPWRRITDGLPPAEGCRAGVVRAHPEKPHLFYLALEDKLFRSQDAGVSWNELRVEWPRDNVLSRPQGFAIAEVELEVVANLDSGQSG